MKWSAHDLLFQLYLSSWNKLKWEWNNRNIKSCGREVQNQRYQIVVVAPELYFSNAINDKRCSSWQGVEICGDWKRLKPWLESGDSGRICSLLLVNPLLQDNFFKKKPFPFPLWTKYTFLQQLKLKILQQLDNWKWEDMLLRRRKYNLFLFVSAYMLRQSLMYSISDKDSIVKGTTNPGA